MTLSTPTSKSQSHSIPPSLKLTPNSNSSSPLLRSSWAPNNTPSSPRKLRATSVDRDAYGLSLKRMIGTTTCSNTGLATHAASRSIAFCAGGAVCVVQVDKDLQIVQRCFLRARPNAVASNVGAGVMSTPSTPNSHGDGNRRITTAAAGVREAGLGYNPSMFESPGNKNTEESGKNWSARERVKAATTVSFSPDGRFLAVGETGYNPRVLIFSTAQEGSTERAPIAILTEHTFGVRCVAFSPCSRWLASIGTMNDGFVYIWSMPSVKNGPVKLHSSNRCTSLVRDITWMGKSLITVGLRHVKTWKVEEEVTSPQASQKSIQQLFEKLSVTKQRSSGRGPGVLSGRNALLGVMSDNLFTCVVAIDDDKALVATEKGDICLLDDGNQRFTKVASADFGVNCITVDPENKYAWVAGKAGSIRTLVLEELMKPWTPPESPSSRSGSPVLPQGCKPANVIAMTNIGEHLVLIDSNRSIKVVNLRSDMSRPIPDSVAYEFPAHKDSVQGVRIMPPSAYIQADFFTWSVCGTVLFWDAEGLFKGEMTIELEQTADPDDDMLNELKVVEVTQSANAFVSGDKFGVLRIIDAQTHACIFAAKAHSGEIMSLAVYEGRKATIVASSARDRTVQVFAKLHNKQDGGWSHIQTLDDHTASVTRVRFMESGTRLLSCSADRTIVIRELAMKEADNGDVSLLAFLHLRTLTLKFAPMSMTPSSETSSKLMVSTTGRQIYKFDIQTGKELQTFRTIDDNGETVALDAVALAKETRQNPKGRLLAGISSTDKSIRLYDMAGNFIDKEWGHTEGVTDIAMLETSKHADDGSASNVSIISTGTDGTVMMWTYSPKPGENDSGGDFNTPNGKDAAASKAPLRKVLSKAEISELTRARSPEKDGTTPTNGKNKENLTVGTHSRRRDSKILDTPKTDTTPTPAAKLKNITNEQAKSVKLRNSSASMTKSSSAPRLNLPVASRPNRPHSPRARSYEETQTDNETSYNTGTVRRRPSRVSVATGTRAFNRHRTPSPPDSIKSKIPSRRPNFADPTKNSNSSNRSSAGGNHEAAAGANANALAEQLTRSLKLFRRRIEGSQEMVRAETRKELEKELGLTLKSMGAEVPSKGLGSPMRSPVSGSEGAQSLNTSFGSTATEGDDPMVRFLSLYSERLLQMVDEGMKKSEGEKAADPVADQVASTPVSSESV